MDKRLSHLNKYLSRSDKYESLSDVSLLSQVNSVTPCSSPEVSRKTTECKGKLLHQHDEVTLTWEIADFASMLDKNEYVRSPPITALDTLWNLEFGVRNISLENGDKSEDWIVVLLKRSEVDPPVMVQCKLKIYKSMEMKFFRIFCGIFSTKSFHRCNIMKKSSFLVNKHAKVDSDTLSIWCSMKFTDLKSLPTKFAQLDDLSENLESLFKSNAHSDVIFRVQGKEFKAHRSILAARSEVLAAMFQPELSESENGVVDILDCDPGAFEIFLQYLYTGRADVTPENVIQLCEIAHKYGDEYFHNICLSLRVHNMSADSLADLAMLAQFPGKEFLFCTVQIFFNENVEAVLGTESWEELMRTDHRLANTLLKGAFVSNDENLD